MGPGLAVVNVNAPFLPSRILPSLLVGKDMNHMPPNVKLTLGRGCRREVDGAQENRPENLIHLERAENKAMRKKVAQVSRRWNEGQSAWKSEHREICVPPKCR